MITTKQTLNKINIEDLGSTIEETFNIYKKTAVINGLFIMILVLFLMALAGIGMSYFFNAADLTESIKTFKPENLAQNEILILVGISIIINVLIIPFVAGMLKVNQEADKTGETKFATIYSLVDNPIYIQLVLGIILGTILSSIINYLPIFIGLDKKFQMIFTILGYIFAIFNFMTIPIIALKNANFIDATVLSFKATSSNLFFIIIMMILGIIGASIGLFAFCIGLFFTAPIFYTVQYVLYKRIFEEKELKA